MSKVILSVIGTAQDGGIPHPNCFCENCKASMDNHLLRRSAASLAIILPAEKIWHLIDATPDMKEQMSKLQESYHLEGQIMSSIFLTHAHMGHLPGLLFLGKESINANQVPVFTGAKLKSMLENNAPWSILTKQENIIVKELRNDTTVRLSDFVSVTPVSVPHRNEFSETLAFWINGPNKRVLYIPDIDRWEDWEKDIVEASKEADICLLDGTFHSPKDLEHIKRDYREIPHPLMTVTMDKLQEVASETQIFFTHLNHSNPAVHLNGKVRRDIEMRGFYIADEGMEFIL